MKKLHLSLIALSVTAATAGFMAIGGNDNETVLSNEEVEAMWSTERATLCTDDVSLPLAKPAAQSGATTLSANYESVTPLVGTYFNERTNYGNTAALIAPNITIAATENPAQIEITNLMGNEASLIANVELANNSFSIPGGVDLGWIGEDHIVGYYCDYAKFQYYPNIPIQGHILEGGVLQIEGFVAVCDEGPNKDGQMMVTGMELSKYNASMQNESLIFENPEAVPVHIRHTSAGSIAIKNFYGYGATVTATLDSVGNMQLTSAASLASISGTAYKNYLVNVLNETTPASTTLKSGNIPAKWEDKTITINAWAVANGTGTTAKKYDILKQTVITTEEAFAPLSAAITFEGKGTEEEPFLIQDADDLLALSRITNYNASVVKSSKVFAGVYFKQTENINMEDIEAFEPISSVDAKAFGGVYDGDGKVIVNLNVNETRKAATNRAGLFGSIAQDAVVKNLTFINPTIKSVNIAVGVIAGYSKGTIENCAVINGVIDTELSTKVGMVVGELIEPGVIKNIAVTGKITAQDYIGGAVGSSNGGKMIEVTSEVNLNKSLSGASAAKMGGIVSNLTRTTGLVDKCAYYGMINGNASELAGGIVGYGELATVSECFFAGQINHNPKSSSTAMIGGIAGQAKGVIFEDCLMGGTVSAYAATNVGGLVGSLENKSATELTSVKNSLNVGSVLCDNGVRGNEFFGAAPDDFEAENTYFDNQASWNHGKGGLSTKALTSGTLPEGFNTEKWGVVEGSYPMLDNFFMTPQATVVRTPFFLADGEVKGDIHTGFTLGENSEVIWFFLNGNQASYSGNGLRIDGNNVLITASEITSDILVAQHTSGEAFKMYSVKTAPKQFDGNGTAEDPFLIHNLTELNAMFNAVDVQLYDFTGKYFRLTDDIDFAGVEDFPGYSVNGVNYAFNGTLDGDGHTIKNLVTKVDATTNSNKSAGFMIFVGKDAAVKNLTFDSSCSFEGISVVGPFCANSGVLSGIVNHANVTAYYQYAGGIAGINGDNAKIENCYNDGNVTSGRFYAGGITSYNTSTVDACQNAGNVASKLLTIEEREIQFNTDATSCLYAGGIVGNNLGNVLNSLNQATITAAGGYVGGITGMHQATGSLVLKGNLNTGIVEDGVDASRHGAITGSAATSSLSTISDNVYDYQFSANAAGSNMTLDGCAALTTKALTSGTLPEGLEAELWKAEAGKYPVLARYADEPVGQFYASNYVVFANEPRVESRFDNRSDASVVLADATVEVTTDDTYKVTGNVLSHDVTSDVQRASMKITSNNLDGRVIEFSLFATPRLLEKGSGLATDPWIIESAMDWNTVSIYSEENHAQFVDEYFALGADLDFNDEGLIVWCGDGETYFQGHLDGQGHTIKNAVFQSTDSKEGKNKGLFGMVGSLAVIHDLVVDKSCSIQGYEAVGMIAGTLGGEVYNVKNYGNVTASNMTGAGGIAGIGTTGAKIYCCENYGDITALKNNACGGIIGKYEADKVEIHHNLNYGKITAAGSCGGIIGSTKGNPGWKNVNYGDVTSTAANAGGVVGYAWTQLDDCNTIDDCANYGKVYATTTAAGGICANLFRAQQVTNCVNFGEVYAKTGQAGGIVGTAGNYAHNIKNVENYGNVSGKTAVGGLVGKTAGNATNMTTLQGINHGEVVSESNQAGGIVGTMSGVTIYDSYNAAPVSGTYEIGGIAGSASTTLNINTIENCFNVGAVVSTGTSATTSWKIGGICGYGPVIVKSCHNVGDLAGYKNVAGIVGLPYKGTSATALGTQIIDSYNVGRVECLAAANESSCGNIYGGSGTTTAITNVKYENCHYDVQMAGAGSEAFADVNDENLVPATVVSLAQANLGSGYATSSNFYPVHSVHAESPAALVGSAVVNLCEGDHADQVTKSFTVAAPEGAEWKAMTEGVTIDDKGNVSWTGVTPGEYITLNAVSDKLVKYHDDITTAPRVARFKVMAASAVVAIDADASADADAIYYDLNGIRVERPAQGVYIRVIGDKADKVIIR